MTDKILLIIAGILLGTAVYYILVYILEFKLGQKELLAKTQLYFMHENMETLRKDYTRATRKAEEFRNALDISKEDKVDEELLKKLADNPTLRRKTLNLTVDIVGACHRILDNARQFQIKDNKELLDSVELMSVAYRNILTYIAYLEYSDSESLSEGDFAW